MNSTLSIILIDNKIISDESKTKVCMITDIAKMLKLNGSHIPLSTEQFNTMYDMSIQELTIMSNRIQDTCRTGVGNIVVDWMNIGKE